MKKTMIFQMLFCLVAVIALPAWSVETEMTITKTYLNFPVSRKAEMKTMKLIVNGNPEREFNIRLARTNPEYWVFMDVSAYKGKKVKLLFDDAVADLSVIYQDNMIAGQDSLYSEMNRPQFHFTPKRGWNNDPNGLLYYNGVYHLFFQHNPYDVLWGNMHWGHAVSKDLLHWTELPEALYPDQLGTMFSGSGVVDVNNTSGLKNGPESTLMVFYTAAGGTSGISEGKSFSQCMAYSNDKGQTWIKYSGNPVLPNVVPENRDPKVFWHQATGKWVMVVYENDGNSIYTSSNLKDWQRESHVSGFFECPELFELPVDGDPNNTRWVMYGASGTYMLGTFDGKEFTPESTKKLYTSGALYAAQTYNNLPASDGRRIQIGWGRIPQPGMPFGQMMLFPTEFTLKTTKDGIRLFSTPISEIESLKKTEQQWNNLTPDEANQKLAQFGPRELLRVKVKIALEAFFPAVLNLGGNPVVKYDPNFSLINDIPYFTDNPESMELSMELLIDRTSVEVFIDGGSYSYSMERKPAVNAEGLAFATRSRFRVLNLEVQTLNSVWNP
jgi:fructan beta-fructosidase